MQLLLSFLIIVNTICRLNIIAVESLITYEIDFQTVSFTATIFLGN